MSNPELVTHVYERLEHGDVPSILAAFDPHIEFRLAEGHPYQPDGTVWVGRDAVTQNFFMRAGREWEAWTIAVDSLLDLGDAVVVECRYAGVYKPTGRKLDAQACHVWTCGNGKITSFHQYIDTARLQEVMGYVQAGPSARRGGER